jgi:hypothetical protein
MAVSSALQQIMDKGYLFRPVDYISRGFSLFKAKPWLFVFITVVVIAVDVAMDYFPVQEVSLVVSLLVTPFVLFPVLRIGFFTAGRNLDADQKVSIGSFLGGFSKVGLLAVTELLALTASLVAAIPGILIMLLGIDSELLLQALANSSDVDSFLHRPLFFWLGLTVAALLSYTCYVFLFWGSPLVYFFNLDPWTGLQSSARLVRKAWKQVSYFILLVFMVAIGGFLFLGIGLLISLPSMALADYAAFADVTGLRLQDDNGSGIDQ